MELRSHSAVGRAWTRSGEILYVLKEDKSAYVHKMSSVFNNVQSTVADLLSKSS